ncbi:hypothetical protein AB0N05_10155 [Nocardia sp. NPDC051030]|uniref:hypothetical protein n=1 Tax=Nocardia sp. NPDC051030 TaxID=3155162 RepID=UPI003429B25C
MRTVGGTRRFGVWRGSAATLAAAVLLTGAVGLAAAQDPAAPPAAPTVEPPTQGAPVTAVPTVEATVVAPTTVPTTTVPPTTQPVPVTTVPAVDPVTPPTLPTLPDLPSSAPTTPVSSTPLFTLTGMPNGWQSRTDLHPALEVQFDGRAVKWIGSQRVTGTIPADVLTSAAAEVRALALVDVGMPTVSDQGTTIIDFMPAAPDQDVHLVVYAPEWTEGITDEQKAARLRVSDVYQRLLNAFIPA